MKKNLCRWMCVVVIAIASAASAWALDVTLYVSPHPSESSEYYGVWVVKGKAAYPYTNPAEGLNQMMAKRLAVHDGFIKMVRTLPLASAYLEAGQQPHIVDDFVQGISAGATRMDKSGVEVDVFAMFVIKKAAVDKLKEDLKTQVSVQELPRLQSVVASPGTFVISREYWDQLIGFSQKMAND